MERSLGNVLTPRLAQAEEDPGIKVGRTHFNNACSHCHGVNGASVISERRLKLRYKDNWREVASKTIKEGRPDAGMPPWKAVYNDKEIENILSFISAIQK